MRHCRLTMGTSVASGELAKALRPLFMHIPEVHVIHDDMLIATEDEVRHEQVVQEVLQIIEDSGLTLKGEKCRFFQSEVPFWGLLVNNEGLRADPEKVEALRTATRPNSKSELMSFLCMVQSNRDFIPAIARHTVHLRKLTKKHARFNWSSKCEEEFKKLKELFSEKTIMNHFDPTKGTFVVVDAHRSGLSALLMQGDTLETAKMVACASRATTPVERRYPQLDLEALAIDFGLRRYRYHCVGGPRVKVVTDHKPLVGVFRNSRRGSIRSENIKLRHQDVDYVVEFCKGEKNPADYLSRHSTPLTKVPMSWKRETEEFEKTIWFVQFSPYTESISLDRIKEETGKDEVLQKLVGALEKGYIASKDPELKPYKQVFHCLTLSDEGLVLKDAQIVLPHSLRKLALSKAHQGGHPGINGLKRRIRSHFWFPKMDDLIQRKIKSCKECQMFTNKTTHEPISPHSTSSKSWEDVSVDLFGPMPNGKHVVAVLDKTSRYPAAKVVDNTSAKMVTTALSGIYADYGQPGTHQTDNGPPFNSEAFTQFSDNNGITHIKTHPYHPQGNPVENFMRPLGKSMKAAHYNKQNKDEALNQMLSNYRATPHPSTGIAPGDMMFRSGYKKDFPRRVVTANEIVEALEADRDLRTRKGDAMNESNHRCATIVVPGDNVLVRNMVRNKFDPLFGPVLHKVIDIKGNGVTLLRSSDDKLVRRHLDDVKPAVWTDEEYDGWMDTFPQGNYVPADGGEVLQGVVEGEEDVGEVLPPRRRRLPPHLRDGTYVLY